MLRVRRPTSNSSLFLLPSPDPLGIALEPRHGIRDPRRDPEIAYKFICPFKRDIVLLADKRRLADIASCTYLRQRNKNFVTFVIKRETFVCDFCLIKRETIENFSQNGIEKILAS